MIDLLPLMSYCFVMSATPGPNNVMLATTGANFGYRGALPVILGIQAGIFVQTMLMCVGLGSVFVAYPMAQQVLRIAGALYLMFLAWKLAGASVAGSSAPKAVSFAQAALFQALNPKSWLKAITMASVFMPAHSDMLASALLVSVIGTVVGMPCNAMWALFGVSIRSVLKAPRNQRIFNLAMGGILLVLAVMFYVKLPPMFAIDRSSPIALFKQIEAAVRQQIAQRVLPGGTRLPSIRQLATQLAVSTNTVVVAYDRLVAAGVIDTHGTTGFFVCAPMDASRAIPDEVALEAGQEQEPVWLSQQVNDQRPGVLLASSGALPPTWLHDALPAAAVQRGLARSAAGMASRCPPQGLAELREQIALLMRGIGIAADAGHILTTFGGTHAIDLICRTFLQPGDTVLVEDPGYFLMFGRLRQDGVRLLPIRRRPDGLDLDELEAACRVHRPRLLFMQTALHNPTGWSSSAANLHKVLIMAQQYGFLIAEDDVHGHFQPGHSTRLASLSGLDGVIYYSSLCKALSPALRMGYLAAAPALLKPLMRTKIHSIMTLPALNEYVLLEVLKAGNLRKHMERLQRKIMVARNASTRQLSAAGVLFEQPGDAGIFLWGSMPEGLDVDLLVQDAYRNKILLMRGAAFSANDTPDQHIRFNVAFSQHPRVSAYLEERLHALAGARSSLARASAAASIARKDA